ncbi:MAG TPA: hypothetical protein VFX92_13325 [Candidatus Krumholzibacteria bacterium]|nr:hypothetical protein [Candidatus Krumholzibacteria bacterium]
MRRARVARCMRNFPEVRSMLETNEINLSTVTMIARFLNPENQDRLLQSIRGCSQAQVRELIASLEPRRRPADVIRPVAVRRTIPPPVPLLVVPLPATQRPEETPAPARGLAVAHSACESNAYRRSGGDVERAPDGAAEPTPADGVGGAPVNVTNGGPNEPVLVRAVETELCTRLSFTASAAFMGKLDRIKALAWHRLGGDPSLETVFEMTMALFLEKNDPVRRRERRQARERRAAARPAADLA